MTGRPWGRTFGSYWAAPRPIPPGPASPVPLLHRGPTAALPPDALARLPQTPAGERVEVGTFALATSDDDERHLTIDIEGFIGWWDTSSDYFKRVVKNARPTRITLRIASPGGFVADALAIHDFIRDYARDHDCPVTALVHGMTASAATVIAVAADRVRMSENALFLVHKPWGVAFGHDEDLAVAAREFAKFNRVFERLYARKTGRDRAEIAEHIGANKGQGEWWDAETALDLGYVDEVYVPGSPDGDGAGAQAEGSQQQAPVVALAAALRLPQIPAGFAPATPTPAEAEGSPTPEPAPAAPPAQDLSEDRLRSLHATLTRCLDAFEAA